MTKRRLNLPIKKRPIMVIGDSEKDSDWIKYIPGRKSREEELKIHDELEKNRSDGRGV